MTAWKKVAKCGREFLWVRGEGKQAQAVISAKEPGAEAKARSLYSVLSQLDPTEWESLDETAADRPVR